MAPSFQCNTYDSVTYIKIKYLLTTSLLLEDRDCIIFIRGLPQHLRLLCSQEALSVIKLS